MVFSKNVQRAHAFSCEVVSPINGEVSAQSADRGARLR